MLSNDLLAFAITLALSLVWLRFVAFAVLKGWISNTISRKVIHIGTGPLFVACWLLFTDAAGSRWLAAEVPFLSTLQFGLAGLGLIRDRGSVASMSRSGVRSELLRGPFLYGLVFIAVTLLFWRTTPVGIVTLMVLCGGDGLADLFGKRYGKVTLPWSAAKTWAGSLAMWGGGFFLSSLMLFLFVQAGIFSLDWILSARKLLLITFTAALVEAVSPSDVDNLSVPLVTAAAGYLLGM